MDVGEIKRPADKSKNNGGFYEEIRNVQELHEIWRYGKGKNCLQLLYQFENVVN